MNQDQLYERCHKIQLVITDIDGILTDGGMYYGEDGNELKKFNVRDGAGVALLKAANIQVGIMTGEASPLIERRAKKIGVDFFFMDVKNKLTCLKEYTKKAGFSLEETVYIGDEINDYLLIGQTGLFFTVPDASEIVRDRANWILETSGGDGVLREVALIILKAQGKLETALQTYVDQCK